ncbi:MAG: CopG family antitoxin [Anaerolineae bacterium]
MAGNNKQIDTIPEEFQTLEELQDFWDSHSLADYDELLHDVEFEVDIRQRRYLVALEPELARKIAAQAQARGISTETLVNLWLSEKVQEIA